MGSDSKMVVSTPWITTWFSTHNSVASDDQSLALNTAQPSISGALYHVGDLQIGMVHEINSMYGQPVSAGNSMATGADTAFVAWDHGTSFGSGYSLDLSASLGYSRLAGVNQLVNNVDQITLASAAVGFGKSGVFADSDRLGLVVSMPNHTINGSASLLMPVSRDMEGNITYQSQSLNLVGTGTETDIQAYWTNQFSDRNQLSLAAGVRLQPEGDSNAAADGIAMLRWNLKF
jgi:hypothetical protein